MGAYSSYPLADWEPLVGADWGATAFWLLAGPNGWTDGSLTLDSGSGASFSGQASMLTCLLVLLGIAAGVNLMILVGILMVLLPHVGGSVLSQDPCRLFRGLKFGGHPCPASS